MIAVRVYLALRKSDGHVLLFGNMRWWFEFALETHGAFAEWDDVAVEIVVIPRHRNVSNPEEHKE